MSEKIDLMKLNDRHEYEQFKDVNFSGKHITKIKFNNISFLNCDFTGAVISVCNFNERCEFANCDFTGATILNCIFNDTTLLECNFAKTKIEDVTIEDTCNLIRNNFSDDCVINNFKVRGAEVEDITDLVSETEEEATEEETLSSDTTETTETTTTEAVEEELEEREDRQDPEVDFKLYNALFPEILKLYPALQKDEYGYGLTVDEVEFGIGPDLDSCAWRFVFMVRDTDDSLACDTVIVDTTKEITFDTLKEAFDDIVKGVAQGIAERTDSQVIKSSLKKFTQEVFKENVITESLTNDTLLVSVYDSPTDVTGLFSVGYDMTTNTTCVIVGKPFLTNNIAEGNKVREIIKQFGFVINSDILNMSNEDLFEFSNLHPYTCFVYEHSDLVDRVNARTFGKG